MKKIYSLFLLALLPLAAYADAVEIDGIYYNLNAGNNTAEVTSNPNNYSGAVSIPATVTYGNVNYNVTSIGIEAFIDCSELTSVNIPNSVNKIEANAFWGCSSITHIEIPNGLTSIEHDTFYDCSGLVSVTIPEGVNILDEGAFNGCASLASVNLPNSLKTIGRGAFYGCALTSIEIPQNVTFIDEGAFDDCSSLTSIIILSKNITIGYALDNLPNLHELIIKADEISISFDGNDYDIKDVYCYAESDKIEWDGVGFRKNTKFHVIDKTNYKAKFPQARFEFVDFPVISDGIKYAISDKSAHVVANTDKYKGDIEIAASVELNSVSYPVVAIDNEAFYDCGELTSVIIPNSVTLIGDYAFYGCFKLTSIDIPNSVTLIGECAFDGCSDLVSVTFGSGVTSIKNDAFVFCHKLEKVIVSDISAWCAISFENEESNPLYHANHLYSEENTEITNLEIPSGVSSISKHAFQNCEGLHSLTIPNSVSSIGNNAFFGCNNMTSLTINSAELTINSAEISLYENAFMNCRSITDVYCYTESENLEWAGSFFPSSAFVEFHVFDKTAYETKFPNSGVIFDDGLRTIVCDGITYEIISTTDKTAKVVASEEGYKGDIEIAASIISNNVTYSVVAIDDKAFYDCDELTSVTIPTSVKSIGYQAFLNCNRITSITIPDGITSIEDGTFSDCNSLTSITIPSSVTSIGDWAFASCGFQSLTIGNNVESIGSYAFAYCSTLTSITISNNITSIAESTFERCSSLTSFVIPDNITSIGERAFYDCSSLTSIVIPNGVTSIESYAFSDCKNLAAIEIPSSVISIGAGAFSGCKNLTTISINSSEIAIGDYSFSACQNIETITILSSEISFAENAFMSCTSITDVYCYTEPEKVEWQGRFFPSKAFVKFHVFDKTAYETKFPNSGVIFDDGLRTIVCNGITYEIISTTDKTAKVVASEEKYVGDIEIAPSITFGNNVTFSVVAIGVDAFYNCAALTSVSIPNSVISIGDYAFSDCSGLTSVSIPSSVSILGEGAFSGCAGLTSVTIPNNVTSIGESAFSNCSKISSVSLPSEITSISKGTFEDCIGLLSITIPDAVTSIEGNAFIRCTNLTHVSLGKGIKNIDISSFFGCANITSLDINCKEIGNWFHDYDKLETVIIHDNVTSIGEEAFYSCDALSSFIIPNNVTEIGDYAFAHCSNLSSVSIGNGITFIGKGSFFGCSNLNSVKVQWNQPIAIEENVFNYRSQGTLYVPFGTKSIYGTADYWKDFKEIREFSENCTIIPADELFYGSNLWAGYVAQEDLILGYGLKAYVITDLGSTTATASEIDYMPQGVPVLLKRENASINSITIAPGTGTDPTTNLLKVYDIDKSVANREGFILYNDEFVLVNEGILPAGRIFLPTNKVLSTRGLTRSIVIDGDGTTGIEDNYIVADDSDDKWYDLQGRRFEKKPTKKGIYILNGRKVVVK